MTKEEGYLEKVVDIVFEMSRYSPDDKRFFDCVRALYKTSEEIADYLDNRHSRGIYTNEEA